MKNHEKIYQSLREKYTDEEIAEAMMIPAELTPEEQNQASKDVLAFRAKLLAKQDENSRVSSDLLRLRFQIENYLDQGYFIAEHSFGKYLEEYLRIINRNKKKLSEDLDIHYTKLSRLFNDREIPNTAFLYRLEAHTNNTIPAVSWWKLIIRKQEQEIVQNKTLRQQEAAKIKDKSHHL